MKKDNFLRGAFIATICLIITKILGIIYVIPFYSIIGSEGSVIYGCAYNIYAVFVNISTVGIPLAISKMVSEYNTLDYQYAKKRTYQLACRIMIVTSIVSTIVLFIFAPILARVIMSSPDLSSIGSTVAMSLMSKINLIHQQSMISDISFVIRVSSTALFFVTLISMIRGYLQGMKYIQASSVAQVLEQLVRVIIIILGSFLCVKVFHTSIAFAVGVAVFGATMGAIVSFVYLRYKKSQIPVNDDYCIKEVEKSITNKSVIKKILTYTIPFVVMGIIGTSFELVDMFTVVRTLTETANYTVTDASVIMNIVTTLGSKLNVIVVAVANGIVVSLLPNLTSDFVKGEINQVKKKINKTLQMIIYITLPMATGLSLLAVPVWNMFYGESVYGPKVFMFSIFVAVFSSIFTNVIISMQSLSRYKKLYISLAAGFLFNAVMNIPFMILFHKIGLPIYYGNLFATMLGYSISIFISLHDLKKTFNIKYGNTIRRVVKSIFAVLVMSLVITLLKQFIPVDNYSRIGSCLIVIFYAIVGALVYFFLTYKMGVFNSIIGNDIKRRKITNEE